MDDELTVWASKLYEQFSDDVYRYIYYFVHQPEVAEDLTQETYFRAIRAKDSYKKDANEKTWLYTIARNVSLDHLRRRRLISWVTLNKNHASTMKSPDNYMEEEETVQKLYVIIKKLKRPHQEVIYLRKIEELSIKDTCRVLDWSESKVKNTLSRALSLLKEELKKEGYPYDFYQS